MKSTSRKQKSLKEIRLGKACKDKLSEGCQMHEKDIVSTILRYLKSVPDCFPWKENGGMYGTAGLPDIIARIGGRFYAFEVKTPSGKLTKLQEITNRKSKPQAGRHL